MWRYFLIESFWPHFEFVHPSFLSLHGGLYHHGLTHCFCHCISSDKDRTIHQLFRAVFHPSASKAEVCWVLVSSNFGEVFAVFFIFHSGKDPGAACSSPNSISTHDLAQSLCLYLQYSFISVVWTASYSTSPIWSSIWPFSIILWLHQLWRK